MGRGERRERERLTTEVKMEGGEEELTKERTGEKRPLRAWRGPRAWGVGGREGREGGQGGREGEREEGRERRERGRERGKE